MSKDASFSAILPWRSFRGEGEMDLRDPGFMQGFAMAGPSVEGTTRAQLVSISDHITNAIRQLGTNDTVHFLFHRLPAPTPPLQTFPTEAATLVHNEMRDHFIAGEYWTTRARCYLIHHYESAVSSGVKELLFGSRELAGQHREASIEAARIRFRGFKDAVSRELGLRPLSNTEMFRDLVLTATGKDFPALLPDPGIKLSEAIAQEYWYGGKNPAVGEIHQRPLSIIGFPFDAWPQLLTALLHSPGHLLLSARFICLDAVEVQALLREHRDYFKKSAWERGIDYILAALNKVNQKAEYPEHTKDQIAEVDAATTASLGGMPFGYVSITAIVRSTNAAQADIRAREMIKEVNGLGMVARLEDINAVAAIRSTFPGDVVSNKRRPLVKASTFVRLMLPIERWPGTEYMSSDIVPEKTPVPIVINGSGCQPFWWPTHTRNGVGHTLVFGSTGNGKSTLLGAMIASYTGIPKARIVFLDLDYSSFVLAQHLKAQYHDMGADGTTPLCPLAMLDTDGGEEWLLGWFARLFAKWMDPETGRGFELDDRQTEKFARYLRLARANGVRTLSKFQEYIDDTDRKVKRIVRAYTSLSTVGRWGHIFDGDGEGNGNTLPNLTIYELSGATGDKRAATPAIEIILQSVMNRMDGLCPVFIFMDEFWSTLSNPDTADWIIEAIRMFRRRGGSLIAATQSISEVANSPLRDIILEQMPTKIFLPNPELTGQFSRRNYLNLGVNEQEIDIIADAAPGAEYYYRSPEGRRLVEFKLKGVSRSICGSTSYRHVARARKILKETGRETFTQEWLKESQAAHAS